MARPKNIKNLSSDQLYKLWQQTVAKEESIKRDLLAKARATVKELEAWFAGKKSSKGKAKSSFAPKRTKKSRAKRGGLKKAVLAYLAHGPQPIKSIVVATKGNYASVSQTLNNLKKEKLVTKSKERGSPYTLVR